MTHPYTLQGTGKRFVTIKERWARFYFRPNTWSKHFLSVETLFLRPHSGPICAVMEVPPTSMTHQCARLSPGHGSRAVTARRERSSASYEPLKKHDHECRTSGTGPARALPEAPWSSMTHTHTPQGTGKWLGTIEESWARFYFRPNTWSKYFEVSRHCF